MKCPTFLDVLDWNLKYFDPEEVFVYSLKGLTPNYRFESVLGSLKRDLWYHLQNRIQQNLSDPLNLCLFNGGVRFSRNQSANLSIYLSTCLPVYQSTCLPVYQSHCLPVYPDYLSTSLPVYMSTCLPVYLSTCLPVYLSTCLPVYMFTCLHIYLSTSLPVYLSTCLPVYLSTCLPVCMLLLLVFFLFLFSSWLNKHEPWRILSL